MVQCRLLLDQEYKLVGTALELSFISELEQKKVDALNFIRSDWKYEVEKNKKRELDENRWNHGDKAMIFAFKNEDSVHIQLAPWHGILNISVQVDWIKYAVKFIAHNNIGSNTTSFWNYQNNGVKDFPKGWFFMGIF